MSELAKFPERIREQNPRVIGKEKRILIPEISHVLTSMWARKPNSKLAK